MDTLEQGDTSPDLHNWQSKKIESSRTQNICAEQCFLDRNIQNTEHHCNIFNIESSRTQTICAVQHFQDTIIQNTEYHYKNFKIQSSRTQNTCVVQHFQDRLIQNTKYHRNTFKIESSRTQNICTTFSRWNHLKHRIPLQHFQQVESSTQLLLKHLQKQLRTMWKVDAVTQRQDCLELRGQGASPALCWVM